MFVVKPTQNGEASVTFSVPGTCGALTASVVGEFNQWSRTAHRMTRQGDDFVLKVTIPTGRTYRFRYLLDGERWENDWAADDYVPNEHGGDDSQLDLRASCIRTAGVSGPSSASRELAHRGAPKLSPGWVQ